MSVPKRICYSFCFLLVISLLIGVPQGESATKEDILVEMDEAPQYNISDNRSYTASKDYKFSQSFSIAGNPTVVTKSAAFVEGFSMSGTPTMTIQGDAYFFERISISGTPDFTVRNHVHLYGGGMLTGNSEWKVEKDLYLEEDQDFSFKGNNSHICVEGTIYYSGEKPDYVHEGPCTGNGMYASKVENKNGETEKNIEEEIEKGSPDGTSDDKRKPSLHATLFPSQKSIIKPVNGPAEGFVQLEVSPEGALSSERRQPIDVAFVFDVSGSMNDGSKLSDTKAALTNAVNEFQENGHPDDRFAFIPFSSDVGKVDIISRTSYGVKYENTDIVELTKNLDAINTFAKELVAYGGTNYTQALEKANTVFEGSGRTKSVIFLTDGEPTESQGTDIVKHEKWVKVGEDCRWTLFGRWCEDIYDREEITIEAPHRYTIYTNNTTKVEYLYDGSWRRRYDLTYSQIKASIEGHIVDAAKRLAANNIKLYSVGFGEKENVDMSFLEEISSYTGGRASHATTAFIKSEINKISKEINELAISQINMRVRLPKNVSIQSGSNATLEGDYAVIRLEDISFTEEGALKDVYQHNLPLSFSKAGSYSFDDLQFSYVDVEGERQNHKLDPFSITVVEKAAPGFNGAASFREGEAVESLRNIRDETGNLEINNTFTVDYALQAIGGIGEGELRELVLYQPLPSGILPKDQSIPVVQENGITYAKLSLQNTVAYHGQLSNEKPESIDLMEGNNTNKQLGFTSISLIETNQDNWKLELVTNQNYNRDYNVELVFADETSTYITGLEGNSIWKEAYQLKPVSIRIHTTGEVSYTPEKLSASLPLEAVGAVTTRLPAAEIRYVDSSAGRLMNQLGQPNETVHYEVWLEHEANDFYTLYKTLQDGMITKLAGNTEATSKFVAIAAPYPGIVTDIMYGKNQASIQVTYLDGVKRIINLAPVITAQNEQGESYQVPIASSPFFEWTGDQFSFQQQPNNLIPPTKEVSYQYEVFNKSGDLVDSGFLSKEKSYEAVRSFQPLYQQVVVTAKGGFADSSKQAEFVVQSKMQAPTNVTFQKDNYYMSVGETRDFLSELLFTPADNVIKDVTWSIRDNEGEIVSQDESTLKANKPGFVTLVVDTKSTEPVGVPVEVTQPTLGTVSMSLGEKRSFESLHQQLQRNNSLLHQTKIVNWDVVQSHIVSIIDSESALAAKKLGSTEIVLTLDSGIKASLTIQVTTEQNKHNKW
ncbi:VWA domain-containing protein [Pontibacillus salicampi]|uniref:VWA domain-containing protein n=1 Tax=Pontibacillus salicampi TaxID=1449801 RepID=A0ABV6LJ84_9BACI